MEILLLRLFQDIDKGFNYYKFESILKKQIDYSDLLMDSLQDDKIVKILTLLHKPLALYFKYY